MTLPIRRTTVFAALTFATLAAAAKAGDIAPWGPGADDATFQAMLKSGFRERGIAKVTRLDQDETQAFCSDPALVASKEGAEIAARIEAANAATIRYPADGKWLGDFKAGEAVAQSGRGLTWVDKADAVNGGNCYNCHQISKDEISYGTIGPSLYHYGRTRGTSEEVLRYTWGKIYNSKASNACSNMPRAGHMGIVTEQQIRDLMALLLDPKSPVNQ